MAQANQWHGSPWGREKKIKHTSSIERRRFQHETARVMWALSACQTQTTDAGTTHVQRIVLLDGQVRFPRPTSGVLVQVEALAQLQVLAVVDVIVRGYAHGYAHSASKNAKPRRPTGHRYTPGVKTTAIRIAYNDGCMAANRRTRWERERETSKKRNDARQSSRPATCAY